VSHDHHDHGTASGQDGLSEKEKLERLLEHWIKHNNDHIKTYREWSEKAEALNFQDVATLLEEACEITGSLNELFKRAIEKLD
jgi:rubrerythrin